LTDNGPISQQATVYNGLGLHPTRLTRIMRHWPDEAMTVTHTMSGRALANGLPYRTALRLIKALLALPIDWTTPRPTGDTAVITTAMTTIKAYQMERR
jgi:hypothetical protein